MHWLLPANRLGPKGSAIRAVAPVGRRRFATLRFACPPSPAASTEPHAYAYRMLVIGARAESLSSADRDNAQDSYGLANDPDTELHVGLWGYPRRSRSRRDAGSPYTLTIA
jgi:hypothetical protein